MLSTITPSASAPEILNTKNIAANIDDLKIKLNELYKEYVKHFIQLKDNPTSDNDNFLKNIAQNITSEQQNLYAINMNIQTNINNLSNYLKTHNKKIKDTKNILNIHIFENKNLKTEEHTTTLLVNDYVDKYNYLYKTNTLLTLGIFFNCYLSYKFYRNNII